MKTFFHFLGMLLHVKHERHRKKIYEIVLIEVNVLKKVETLKKYVDHGMEVTKTI